MYAKKAPEHTPEDVQRTQGKILNAFTSGHGVTLEPPEVERLVGMMQAMEMLVQQNQHRLVQTQALMGGVLVHISDAAGPEALAFPAEIMDSGLAGFSVHWDETEETITFELEYPAEVEAVEVDGQMVAGSGADAA